ncbi:heme-thiolate peroxidase [Antrodiella citrinella]|uniref:Heme-thiolate peroxidase n=1 Tax=Antrodiella citrinella TaxID=2447956 RepID=A0A4S4MUP4_9APHY|nr:heme-thiolate peroxidase [Antrodiella citrinella]
MPSDSLQASGSFLVVALSNIFGGVVASIHGVLMIIVVLVWDFGIVIFNLSTPNHASTRVVPQGYAGANGLWPKYDPPVEGNSRCSCPALNAMANHGILPHDGRNITFRELNTAVRTTYNFAPSFCYFVPNHMAGILDRNYWSDRFDLADLDVHNGVEHDASLTREDPFFQNDQSTVSVPLVEKLLKSGTGPNGDLTPADFSRLLSERRAESRARNPQYSQALQHKLLGSFNSAAMLTCFGGKIKDLRPFLLEERIPDNWQPQITSRMGLTLAAVNGVLARVELGVEDVGAKREKLKAA